MCFLYALYFLESKSFIFDWGNAQFVVKQNNVRKLKKNIIFIIKSTANKILRICMEMNLMEE